MTQQHQQQQQQQAQEEGQEQSNSSDESQPDSSDHSDTSEKTSSSSQQNEDSQEDNQEMYPQEQQHNSFIISQEQVLQNSATYGQIANYQDHNSIHIYLYRHPTMLTTEEYKHAQKHFFHYETGQKPCQNFDVVDITKKTMFRCPFPECNHTPLNNLMVHQALTNHCQIYHNDGKNYIFHYKEHLIWKTTSFPPEPTDKNIQNLMTQQYKIQKGQKFYHNSDVNSNNPNEWNNISNYQNNYKGKKNPFPTLPDNSYDKNQYKGKNPISTLPHNSYDKNQYKGPSKILQYLEKKGISPNEKPNYLVKCDICYGLTNKYHICPIIKTNPEDENCSQPSENTSQLDKKQTNESNFQHSENTSKNEKNKLSSSTPPISPPQQITPKASLPETTTSAEN